MIGIVTDSASMLPAAWRDRHRILVAPMTVVIDNVPYREGVDIATADFYRRLAAGAAVTTSAPSPGDLLGAYQTAVADGATAIVSIHTGAEYSAVLDAARIAARDLAVPVELVDTGTVSFPVALCVAAATTTRHDTDDPAVVAAAARSTAAVVDSIFIVGVPDLARRGGRLRDLPINTPTTVLTLGPTGLSEHSQATDIDDAVARMAHHIHTIARARPIRVGVGDAHRPDLGDQLAATLTGHPGIEALTRYTVGPSVGAHTGPGTIGAVWAPIRPDPTTKGPVTP